MLKAKDFRLQAAEEVKSYSKTLAITELFVVVAFIILGGVGFIPYVGPVFSVAILLFIGGPIEFSYVHIAKLVKEKKEVKVEDVFYGFHRYEQVIVLTLLRFAFIFLWTLLLIVPGIIKAYSYSSARFLVYEDPKKSGSVAIEESKTLMNGNKWRLFCLDISYIGWFLLSILTLGILFLWVGPKHQQARYNFFLEISKQEVKKEEPVTETK